MRSVAGGYRFTPTPLGVDRQVGLLIADVLRTAYPPAPYRVDGESHAAASQRPVAGDTLAGLLRRGLGSLGQHKAGVSLQRRMSAWTPTLQNSDAPLQLLPPAFSFLVTGRVTENEDISLMLFSFAPDFVTSIPSTSSEQVIEMVDVLPTTDQGGFQYCGGAPGARPCAIADKDSRPVPRDNEGGCPFSSSTMVGKPRSQRPDRSYLRLRSTNEEFGSALPLSLLTTRQRGIGWPAGPRNGRPRVRRGG